MTAIFKQKLAIEGGECEINSAFPVWPTYAQDEVNAVLNVLKSGRVNYWTGDLGQKFEKQFATYFGVNYAVALANGSVALELALQVLNIGEGDEVIVTPRTFIATVSSICLKGATPIFADVDLNTQYVTAESIQACITPRTKAIIFVHLAGWPCDMKSIIKVAKDNDLKLIEDCAQAHGAEYKGKRIGAIGDIGTFSFYPGKNLGAYGDGGAIVTNNSQLAKKCRMIANHGRIEKYNHEFEGRNSRLDNLQAAVLNVKLGHLENWTSQRIKIADFYLKNLEDINEIVLPKREKWARQVYHLFVIRIKQREKLQDFLREKGIQTGIHYPIALPKLQAYSYMGKSDNNLKANQLDAELLSLPIGEHLEISQAEEVVSALREYYKQQ